LNPLKKKKNWRQIPDSYTQYLLNSTDTQFETWNPRNLKKVHLLQENHQPELITLGSPACTYDLFSHRMIDTHNWAPTAAPCPTSGPTQPSKPNQALLTVGSLQALFTFCLLVTVTNKTFKPHLANSVAPAGPAIMMPQVEPLPRQAAPSPPQYEWNNPTFGNPILPNHFHPVT
jgi:hypothetical protein